MSQRRQLLLFSLAPVFLLLPARPVCPTNSDLDNTLLEQPKISCEESRIKMSIRTERPFTGNVYAKGFFHKDVCRVQGNGSGHVANITIPVNADCGMRRKRSVGPQGLKLEIDVILMFHKKFLTKNDRAFHVECQYVEMDQRVVNRLDISALPSTELSQSVTHTQTMPKCRYEVLSTETGHPISFAAIGQPIMHKWSCQSASKEEGVNMYCLTVHSCEVDDGQGSLQKLLDEKGCPLDKGLFGPVEYKGDLEAVQRGNAFKFADRPTIYFSCQLRLELKTGWKECKRSADKCAAANGEGGANAAASSESAGMKHFSVPPDSEEVGEGDEGLFSSSPEFPTPSPNFSLSSNFPMSTGTTASPPSRGYPANRIKSSQMEKEGEEDEEMEEAEGGGSGGSGSGGGRSQQKGKGRGGGGKAGNGQTGKKGSRGDEESAGTPEDQAASGEGVYVERPALSIINRKTKRTTRAMPSTSISPSSSSSSPSSSTTRKTTSPAAPPAPKPPSGFVMSNNGTGTLVYHRPSPANSATHPPPPAAPLPHPPSPKGDVYLSPSSSHPSSSRGCQFGLNTDCAFDMAQTDIFSKSKEEAEEGKDEEDEEEEEEETSTQSSNDSPKFEGQRFPGRLSLRQRSTTPLEEFERVGRMSQGHTTMNIDVSQAVDVLDVVAQSDASSSSSGESQGAFDKFCRQIHPKKAGRPQADPVEPFQELCISRQLLSSALFLAVLCFLSILTILLCCLCSCQHRLRLQRQTGSSRPKPESAAAVAAAASSSNLSAAMAALRRSRRTFGHSRPVLDAYNP